MTSNNIITEYHKRFDVRPEPQQPDPVSLMLDNMQSERDAIIQRGRHLETVLLQHGRISRRAITNREDGR